MMEKNFKVTVTYTENKDTELEAAFNTLVAAKDYQLEVLSKTAPIIKELREQKASAIFEQCKPLLAIIDNLAKMDCFRSSKFVDVYVYNEADVCFNISLWSNYHKKEEDRIKISCCTSEANIFSSDRYVEEVIGMWNSMHIYELLKKGLLHKMNWAANYYNEKTQESKSRVNALIDD